MDIMSYGAAKKIYDQIDAQLNPLKDNVFTNSINISKGLFTVQAYIKTGLNKLNNMFIDALNDSTGFTGGTFDNTNKCVRNYDANTKLLLFGQGANNSTTIVDETGKTVTAAGNAKISTDQKKYGSSSIYLDGNGDYLSIADSDDWDICNGNFTLEADIFFTSLASRATIIGQNTDGNNYWAFFYNEGGYFQFTAFTSATGRCNQFTNNIVLNPNQWYHVAVSKLDSTMYFALDGVILTTGIATAWNGTMANLASPLYIGYSGYASSPQYFPGYMQNVRLSKGIARYTQAYTPGDITSEVIFNAVPFTTQPNYGYIVADESGYTSNQYSISVDDGVTYTVCPKETLREIANAPTSGNLNVKVKLTGDARLNAIAGGWVDSV